MRHAIIGAAALLAAVAFATGAAAQSAQPTNAGIYKDWNAFTGSDANGKVCFIASQPTDSQYSQTVNGRDPAFFQITSAPANGVRNEASTIVGFTIRTSADVTVDVDGTKFRMFLDPSHPDTAWAVPEQEAQLVDAMRQGSRMTVTAISGRGTTVTDTYSLSGVTAALQKLGEECP